MKAKSMKSLVSIVLVSLMLITVSAAADTGYIQVGSSPDHADVYIEGKLMCTGCTSEPHLILHAQTFRGISFGYHTVTVKKSGYIDWSKDVSISSARDRETVSAYLEPVSAETPAPTITAVPPTPTVSPTPTMTPIPSLTPTPIVTPKSTPAVTPTPVEKGVPGFEAILAIAGFLAVSYLLKRRK